MTDKEVMQMALDALNSKYIVNCGAWQVQRDQAIKALRAALAQRSRWRGVFRTLELLAAIGGCT